MFLHFSGPPPAAQNRHPQGYSEGLIEPKVLRLAFQLYVNNPGYLNAMRLGAARVDLNGEVAGTVDENDAKSAQARTELAAVWPPTASAAREAGHKPQSPLQAIREKCRDCSCYQLNEIRACEAVNCALVAVPGG